MTEDLADDDDEQDGRQLTYKALQAVCEEAVKCNRRTANGQEHFDVQACTYVEANGLFFDDCYEDTCRLPSAPRFEPSSGSGGAADQSDLQAPSSPLAQQPSVSREDNDTLPEQAAEHSQSARADAPDQGAGASTSRLSNLPIDMYPASVKELKVPGRDQPVWTTWLGQYLTLNTYKQLQWLYADWVDGIRVKTADASSEQRVAPLRLLEHQFRTKTHVAPWRSGSKICKAVAERKVLVYAILRRLPDPTALVPNTDSAVSDAIQEVEELRMEHSKSSSSLLSNTQLHDLLTGTPSKGIKGPEEGATEFESGTLGWPQPAFMKNGNLKQKH
ncbi:TPA: hypothetical protein ACH3X1_013587 [Trebouxia sp. C0004]